MLPSQMSLVESAYDPSAVIGPHMSRRGSQVASSQYESAYASPQVPTGYANGVPVSGQRSFDEHAAYDYAGLQAFQAQAHAAGIPTGIAVELTPNGSHARPQQNAFYFQERTSPPHSPTPIQHHHHRLPNQPPPSKSSRLGYPDDASQEHGPPSVVGQEGMPAPALRPKGPKLKFTPDDDALLVDLKETKNLTWKQIADFFPGRSSGTLQVRYCTKLKAKTTVWTDEMVQRLRNAVKEYDNDRWRIISSKVGNGFSAAACKDKAEEFEFENTVDGDGDDTDNGWNIDGAGQERSSDFQKFMDQRRDTLMTPQIGVGAY